jgi:hypothetical protein
MASRNLDVTPSIERKMHMPHSRAMLLGVALALAATVTVGCDPSTPNNGATSTPPTSAPPSVPGDPSDYCALATQILIGSGLMVDGRIITAQEETMDNLKALTDLTLAAKDQLLALIADDVRPALTVELQYFQNLKDHDFSTSTPVPAGLDEAVGRVNAYGKAACGFDFES